MQARWGRVHVAHIVRPERCGEDSSSFCESVSPVSATSWRSTSSSVAFKQPLMVQKYEIQNKTDTVLLNCQLTKIYQLILISIDQSRERHEMHIINCNSQVLRSLGFFEKA